MAHHVREPRPSACVVVAKAEMRSEKSMITDNAIGNGSSPAVRRPVALVQRTLTQVEANGIRQLLDDPNAKKHAGCEMETADVSVIKKKRVK